MQVLSAPTFFCHFPGEVQVSPANSSFAYYARHDGWIAKRGAVEKPIGRGAEALRSAWAYVLTLRDFGIQAQLVGG